MSTSYFVWNADPILLALGPLEVRWYGLLFATGFLVGYSVMEYFAKVEERSSKNYDLLLMVMVASTVIGARLGHCLFYEPEYYLSHPLEILAVWKGGLASHGGAIGILIGLYLYSKNKHTESFSWVVDRMAIVTAFAGACIRTGNFFNSEIIGKPTDVPWAVVFSRIDDIPRHPAQLYEAIAYLLSFVLLLKYYRANEGRPAPYKTFGLFTVLVFGARFFIEFLKENQVSFEQGLLLNMGQLLTVPLLLVGLYLLFRKPQNASA